MTQIEFILTESEEILADRFQRLPPDEVRLSENEALAVVAYTYDLGMNSVIIILLLHILGMNSDSDILLLD